jgi:hypothetical protein
MGRVYVLKFKKLAGATLAALSVSAAPSAAAVLNVSLDGQLMGASGVAVDGILYDVAFRDGTCIELFDGCDTGSDFTFYKSGGPGAASDDAEMASIALLDQVFIDGVDGQFDSISRLTNGLHTNDFGSILTIWGVKSTNVFAAINYSGSGVDEAYRVVGFAPNVDTSTMTYHGYQVYAVWSVAAVSDVPLPAGGVLLLSSLGGVVSLHLRKKRNE